jgi:hypothetical protein
VIPIVNELGRTRIECNVTVKSTFNSKMFALNVVVLVPVPDYTAKANILVTNGKAKYDATKKAIVGGGAPAGWLGPRAGGRSSGSAAAGTCAAARPACWVRRPCLAWPGLRHPLQPSPLQVWKMRKFTGSAEHTLRAEVILVSTTKEHKPWAKPPISMQFQVRARAHACSCPPPPFTPAPALAGGAQHRPHWGRAGLLLLGPWPRPRRGLLRRRRCGHVPPQVPMYSASGLRVSYLKILEKKMGSSYKVEKWVRKLCKSGDFLVRV